MNKMTINRLLALALVSLAVCGSLAAAEPRGYVVKLKASAAVEPNETAADLATTYGTTVVESHGDTFVMYVADSRVRLLAADPRVASVSERGMTPSPDAIVETVNWTNGVSYEYDHSGNVTKVGKDAYVYDTASRLVQSSINGSTTSYEYDAFGNRTKCNQSIASGGTGDCQGYQVDATENKNRLKDVGYDARGNITGIFNRVYSYDPLNLMTREQAAGGGTREFFYNANDERVAVHSVTTGAWRWSIRDESSKVVREFTSNGTSSFSWAKDYVWRDGVLLSSRQPQGALATTYHYHLDHLGTPRRVTDSLDNTIGVHDYYAYGAEAAGGTNEPSIMRMKYTGYERDIELAPSPYDLDYALARYYSSMLGRFFSVDPVLGTPHSPLSWNRYAYAMNNPLKFIDPTGLRPCRYKLRGEDARIMGVPDGTVVDGECVEAKADPTVTEVVLDWVGEHEEFVKSVNNVAAGFSDTITIGATKHIRQLYNIDEYTDPCSRSYIGGQAAGVLWSVAMGGALASEGAAAELGNVTVSSAEFEATLAGLGEAEKLAVLGRGGAILKSFNVLNPAMWSTYWQTLKMGPTAGGAIGLLTGASTGTNAAGHTLMDCF